MVSQTWRRELAGRLQGRRGGSEEHVLEDANRARYCGFLLLRRAATNLTNLE
uniref:Uncharacterized protein n=1 Tax=Oryza sativa subsp. japonica TaxID=39947 RepID=Q5Z962_ORYSJ|nr:hypothetical protein [Oryza sativa Japonica Group]